jgi:hypothetical protein
MSAQRIIRAMQNDPGAAYQERLTARVAAASLQERREATLSNIRLATFAAAVVAAWFAWVRASISPWWVGALALLFVVLIFLHERTSRARRRAERAADVYRRGLARIADQWQTSGSTGDRFSDPHHPYAADLDLFGSGSLFQLLSVARTPAGEETLARWLLHPSDRATIVGRQAAAEELRANLDLREDLAVLGDDIATGAHPADLRAWSDAAPVAYATWERIAAVLLATAGVIAAVGFFPPFSIGPYPITAVLILDFLFYRHVRSRMVASIRGVERASDELALYGTLLERIERERFTSPTLSALSRGLESGAEPASRRIARLGKLIALLESPRNQFFAPFAALLLWTPQVAFAIEKWRTVSGPAVGRWLDAAGEMEALASLSAFSWEHPAYPFPEILEGGRVYDAAALGHPLIPGDRRVANDIRLDEETRLLIVSGSNMSGKSTMLRCIGVNGVLALAGSPVCAGSLRISTIRIGASITIHDSLQEGSSRFYSELTKLRQLVELAGSGVPLLVLLDEIFHGTNSHDRRIGAAAVVSSLIRRGAIGLVTTHDLALSKIADDPTLHARNVHFEDHLENGQMVFDYRMRPGVVEKSNALELMRAVGLEV